MTSEGVVTPAYQVVNGVRIPAAFSAKALKSALEYKPRDDDLFIVTYPKCGTTWVQNIVGNIYRNGKPYETAMEFLSQTPFLEMMGAEAADKIKRPGAIKMHLPYDMTPYNPKAKYIFVARNPKDCCVSFYHHTKNLPVYGFKDGEFDTYFELFMDGKVDFGDYFDTLLSWYDHRNDSNVLFITYEDLQKRTEENVLKIAEFLGSQYKEAILKSPEMLSSVIKHSSISYMKEFLNQYLTELNTIPREYFLDNPDVPEGMKAIVAYGKPIFAEKDEKSKFVRKGIVGDWKNLFTGEQSARLDAKFLERTAGTDIPKLWEECMS